MPRSAEARAFGFRATGLVRILTAADPEEVLTAMEALGIQLIESRTFFEAVQDLVVSSLGPAKELVDLVLEAEAIFQFFFENPGLRFPGTGEDPVAANARIRRQIEKFSLTLDVEQATFQDTIRAE